VRRVGLGAELRAADVAQPHERAVVPGLEDDVVELARVLRRPAARTLSWYMLPGPRGRLPRLPAATCTFCSRSASTTSPAVSAAGGQPVGSSQSRIEYLRSPKMRMSADARHALERVA
jgi:hypothetical protein